jgi:6-pyruvoyltetrahydropterin/6-carboxytetrahydropterin synthase
MHLSYTLAVRRFFVARHFLVGGDWGTENQLHSHQYQVEVRLEGQVLNQHGYLVDIVALEAHLDDLVAYYRDQTLNELPEFAGRNPSLEHFARLLCQELLSRLKDPLHAITAKVWEDDLAWAAYREER